MFHPIWKRQIEDRSHRRKIIQGSPIFNMTITDLAAEAKKIYGFEDDRDIRKFTPLNWIRIMNKGGTTLKAYINQSSTGEEILDDTVWTHTGELYNFTLENMSTTTAATGATIYVKVQRKPAGVIA